MKKSEQLRAQAASEESDLKWLGASTKALREERIEKFEETWLQKLQDRWIMSWEADRGCWIAYNADIDSGPNCKRLFEFFPKANRVFVFKTKNWHKPGLNYIIKHLLNAKKN